MIRWLASLFAWRAVERLGVWVYSENTMTGRRSAHFVGGRCRGPLRNDGWLRPGDIVHGSRGRYVIGSESEVWNG